MSKRSQQKRNARAKEKAAKLRRERGAGPLARLAGGSAGEAAECWMHEAGDEGLVSILAFRGVRGGGTAVACFMVDFFCIGLKDAFYRLDVSMREVLDEYRQRSAGNGMRFGRIELAEVRGLVGAAVRWTREHDFRLPRDWQRCLKILGGEVDTEGGDVGRFGEEGGKLHYVGRQRDLEKLLLTQTLEEFMAREDVMVEFMDAEWAVLDVMAAGEEDFDEDYDEDEEDEMGDEDVAETLGEILDRMREKMLTGVRRWCFQKAVMPHPELEEAVRLTVDAMAAGLEAEDPESEEATEIANRARGQLLALENSGRQAEIGEALEQVETFVKSFETPEAMEAALGLNEE